MINVERTRPVSDLDTPANDEVRFRTQKQVLEAISLMLHLIARIHKNSPNYTGGLYWAAAALEDYHGGKFANNFAHYMETMNEFTVISNRIMIEETAR